MSALQWPQHTRSCPVFVLGCARSGTSLTCRLLLDHLGVNFGTESQFIIRYSRRLRRYGDLSATTNMRRLLTDISRERFFMRTRRNFGFVFDIEQAVRTVAEPTYAGALGAIFGQFAATKGMARWGDKTPEYNHHLDVLLGLFPTAQFLHVVRDPRDVALSQFRTGFGSKNAYDAAVHWRKTVRLVDAFGARLPSGQFMQFRYEDLRDNPAGTLDGVAQFLGMANHAGLVAGIATRLLEQVRTGSVNKGSTGLDRRELACIEAVARAEMYELGYAPVAPGATRVGPFDVARWRAQGMWRRIMDRRYWADTVYRLGLRARPASLLPGPLAGVVTVAKSMTATQPGVSAADTLQPAQATTRPGKTYLQRLEAERANAVASGGAA